MAAGETAAVLLSVYFVCMCVLCACVLFFCSNSVEFQWVVELTPKEPGK